MQRLCDLSVASTNDQDIWDEGKGFVAKRFHGSNTVGVSMLAIGRFVRQSCGVAEDIGIFRLDFEYSESWRDIDHEDLASDSKMSFELNLSMSRGKRFLTRNQLDRLCCAGTGIGQ